MRSTKSIIHLENLAWNIKQIKSLLKPETKMLVPVKANAYGHGTVECAKAALNAGADVLAVATVEEGELLRQNNIECPVIMFSLCAPEEISDCVKYRITPFVFDTEYAQLLNEEAHKQNVKNFPVHIAIDSGMGRIGCFKEDCVELAKFIDSSSNLTLGGMATHFCVSDSKTPENNDFTQKQFEYFMSCVNSVKDAGINPGTIHCANSAATLDHLEMQMDMVRPGIIIYGYNADEVNQKYLETQGKHIQLKPVMTLETQVCAIRKAAKGTSVGYGRTWTAQEDTFIGVLPIGYGDGFLRRNSTGKIQIAINGKNYPVVGRICMDQCMVNLGPAPEVKRWDKAVIFGCKEDGALQDAEKVAELCNTISYEITTGISSRVTRVFTE